MSPGGLSILRFVFTVTSILVICVGARRGFRYDDPWLFAAFLTWGSVFSVSLFYHLGASRAGRP
jgi:hypothetical protein